VNLTIHHHRKTFRMRGAIPPIFYIILCCATHLSTDVFSSTPTFSVVIMIQKKCYAIKHLNSKCGY
jgi:hypothetical protein